MLNSQQSLALNTAVNGHNVLIMGQAGTGKSHTLKTVYKTLSKQRNVALLCTTGMACLQYADYGAKTVHSWAGLFDGRYDILTLKNLVMQDDKYESVRNNVKATDVVIVDEISMLSQKLFEQFEVVCRLMHNKEKYFGGVQVVLCGDFFQLPPVPDDLHNDDGKFCFESEVFKKCITHIVKLEKVVRQEEELLIQAVRETAVGTVSEDVDMFLKSLEKPLPPDIDAVHLFARNIDATLFNNEKLENLNSEGRVYKAEKNNGSLKYLNKILAPNYLHLKITCPVILLSNLGGKLVNGLKGIVQHLQDDTVTVYFPDIDQTHEIKRQLFSKYNMNQKCVVAEREQFPLILGYGMTIHKAQGMTLESVAVHCKGVFQSGQLSVAIGRAVSSTRLYLLNYRKGLCYIPKAVISQFHSAESKEYLIDFSCCLNKTFIEITPDTKTLTHDSDSEFDLDEIDFIEQNLVEHLEDITNIQLPDYIDVHHLKTLNKFTEPVTDIQKKLNDICDECDLVRLTNFCKLEFKRISELLSNISSEKTTTPKEWTSILALNHQYITGEKYKADLKTLFRVYQLSDEYLQFASNIVMEMLKLCVHNIAESVRFSQEHQSVPAGSVSEAGKGKIRYVGGMCVAKISQHYTNIIISNQNNPDHVAQKTMKVSQLKMNLLKSLVAERDLDFQTDKTLQEIERKQNVCKALTHISDQCFQFFINLNGKVFELLNTDVFKTQKMNIFEYTFCQLESDEDLQIFFSGLFFEDIPDIVHSLYKEIVHKYLMVCHKQLLKDTRDRLNIMKKKAHREEIQKKTEKRKSQVELTMQDIVADTSENKESSHMKMKLNCMSNTNYFAGREFTKYKLGKLCSAYDVPIKRSMKKDVIAQILREKIISVDKVVNPELLSPVESSASASTSSQTRKRAKAPSKGKGKGKSKKVAVAKYYCNICREEYADGEEWQQCDECNLWFHRTCVDIEDDEWDDLQSQNNTWTCSSCSP